MSLSSKITNFHCTKGYHTKTQTSNQEYAGVGKLLEENFFSHNAKALWYFECVIAMSTMVTLMPIFLLYSWQCGHGCKTDYQIRKWICAVLRLWSLLEGSVGGGCVYIFTIHWILKLSRAQSGRLLLFIVCTVAQPMSWNFFEIYAKTDQLTDIPMPRCFVTEA